MYGTWPVVKWFVRATRKTDVCRVHGSHASPEGECVGPRPPITCNVLNVTRSRMIEQRTADPSSRRVAVVRTAAGRTEQEMRARDCCYSVGNGSLLRYVRRFGFSFLSVFSLPLV